MAGSRAEITVGRHSVGIPRAQKVLFGSSGITKRDLAEYYAAAAPAMIPHLRGRPLTLHRFPDGIDAQGFIQKQRPEHAPEWVAGTWVERVRGGSIRMLTADSAAVLVWLAGQAAITLHPWPSRKGDLGRPDRLVFDLDPPDDDFGAVKAAAEHLRALLADIALPAYAMTTGSRGMHVVVPIRPELEFDDVRAFAGQAADLLARRHPELLTTHIRIERRGGRLFIDVLRNAYGQHAVAPYSPRPLAGAPIAAPVHWEELEGLPSARAWTLQSIGERLHRDPWSGMGRHAHSLPKAWERLRRLHVPA
jgi:bifunctional non-homologous end joining protein LigD